MDEFNYEAYTRQGDKVTGVEVAETSEAVESILRSRGLMPQRVAKRQQLQLSLAQRKRVSDLDFLVFVSELVVLLKSGMGVPETLAILNSDQESTALAASLNDVEAAIQAGSTFSDACRQHPAVFRPLFISSLKTGEQSGDLLQPLQAYYHQLEQSVELKRKVNQALAYPLFIMATFTIILILMFLFVVPNFVGMYEDMGTELPALTASLLALVERMPWLVLIGGSLLLLALLSMRYLRKRPQGDVRFARLQERLPLSGKIYLLLTFLQFAQSLASLMRGGSTLLYALQTTCEVMTNRHFAKQLELVIERIKQGESLSTALRAETAYPAKSLKMIAVGEESGSLEAMLDSIAGYYERLLDDRIKRITTLVEPAMMLAIGLVVGVVIVALYLPVFGMVNVIG